MSLDFFSSRAVAVCPDLVSVARAARTAKSASFASACGTAPTQMDDDELQAHIEHCGRQLLAAQQMIEGGTPDYFAIMGERDRWLREQHAALVERARRPHIVARMEAERRLA